MRNGRRGTRCERRRPLLALAVAAAWMTTWATAAGAQSGGGRLQTVPGRSGDEARAEDGQRGMVAGDVAGTVVDGATGRPVPYCDLQLLPSERRAMTDERGRFVFHDVEDGSYRVTVGALGYREAVVLVDVAGGDRVLLVELARAPIPLEEVVIAPGRVGALEVTPAAMGNALSRDDLEAIPEFGDDAFRALHRLPGVASDDISTKLHVRGSSERDLLVRLDGVELFEPYHLKDQDGALGIVDIQALGGIDLVAGGFPPEFGNRIAGVFDMSTRRPPAGRTRSTVGMSLSSLSFANQGSFAGGRGQWLVSARRGFLDIVLDIIDSDDDLSPRYWDALGRIQYLVGSNHLFSLNVLHAGDDSRWSDEQDTGSLVNSVWANGYVWAGWEAALSDRIRAKTVLSTGWLDRDRTGGIHDSGDGVFTPLFADVRDRADFSFAGIRQEWQIGLTDDVLLKAGFEGRRSSGDYDYESGATFLDLDDEGRLIHRLDSTRVDLAARSTWAAGWASGRVRIGDAFTAEAGLRYDHHSHTGDADVSPRILARLDLGENSVLRGSWGYYYQTQGIHELSAADGEEDFAPSERAEQVAVGLERRIAGKLTARVEAYSRDVTDPHREYVNLAREINPLLELESDRTRLAPTRGRARGIELSLARDDVAPFTWTASYVLAKSEQKVDGRWAPRTLDQRHTLNVMARWRAGDAWQISGLWQYHTGWPATEQFFDVDVTQDQGGESFSVVRRDFGPLNADNLPAYQRVDLRITRGFDFTWGRLELFLDVFNLTDRTNFKGYAYTLSSEPQQGARLIAERWGGEELLPILPTLGFRVTF